MDAKYKMVVKKLGSMLHVWCSDAIGERIETVAGVRSALHLNGDLWTVDTSPRWDSNDVIAGIVALVDSERVLVE